MTSSAPSALSVALNPLALSVPALWISSFSSNFSSDSTTPSPSPPAASESSMLVDSWTRTGASSSSAFETTSAKSWSVVSPTPGTPSPAIVVPVTVTPRRVTLPAGR